MKSSRIVCTIAALSLSVGSLSAFAQGRVYDRNASNNPEIYRQTHPEDAGNAQNLQGGRDLSNRDNRNRDNRNRDNRNRDNRNFDNRNFERRNDRGDFNRGAPQYYYGARGPEFHRGGYIPREYRNRQYYVNDWRGHHLSAPPRGYQWVQVGADYVLIAIATGVIVNLILNQ